MAAICAAMAGGSAGAEERSFTAEGADAVFGLGARQIAMGGTGTSFVEDPYALYYNPANLAGVDRPTATVGRQLDATLRPFSFIGAALPLGFAQDLGFDATLAIGRYPRIHAHATGAWGPDDFESIFLRFLLPGLKGVYDGTIDSKTLVNRLALGISPDSAPWLRFGGNVDLIDCRTGTCGVSAGNTYSVHATAVAFGLSLAVEPAPGWRLGVDWSDVSPGLTITTLTTHPDGTTELGRDSSDLPRRLAVEAGWQMRDDLLLAVGAQSYAGRYGDYDLAIQTLHMGAEWRPGGPWRLRAGAWAPLKIASSQFAAPKPIIPIAPTLGVGWEAGAIRADLALFAHPINSMHEGAPVLSGEFALTMTF
jgi:hypothetical protein